MNDEETHMSPRYYIAEASIWVLGIILVLCRFVGLAPDQSLPILDVVPQNSHHFPKIVAALLIAAVLYMLVECWQTSRTARRSACVQARAAASVLFAGASLWLSHPIITQDTRFADTSPASCFGFVAIGFILGILVATLASAALMIRNREEAARLGLPRVPTATRAQFMLRVPLLLFVGIGYGALLQISPEALSGLTWLLVGVPFLVPIACKLAYFFFAHDEDGNRVPYAKRLAEFREIYNFHDYACFLGRHGDSILKDFEIPSTASSQDIQKAIQQKFAAQYNEPVRFRVRLQEEIQLLPYPKDGNPANRSPENRGVRINKRKGKPRVLRVLVIPDESNSTSREMEIALPMVEAHAEEYLGSHSDEQDLTFAKMFSYAINQTVVKTMMTKTQQLLYGAAMAGDENMVRELLAKHVDVNEQVEFGWTALLAASAQGYPQILRFLLDAGANPDIGNVQRITPLMYGTRYGNMDICRILLEYGATLDIQDVYGMTALICASRNGHLSIVELLLEAGADPNIKTVDGKTALDFAHACGHGAIAKRLRVRK